MKLLSSGALSAAILAAYCAPVLAADSSTPKSTSAEAVEQAILTSPESQPQSTRSLSGVVAPAVAPVMAPPAAASLRRLTAQAITKELDLMKLNDNLKLYMLPKSPWPGRFWLLVNLANTTLTATGAFINGFGHEKYRHRTAPKYLFPNGGWCRVTANFETVGGAMLEIAYLAYRDIYDKAHGTDLGSLRKYAEGLRCDIDRLLAARAALVANSGALGANRQMMDAETCLLRDVRNLGVNEFARWYADAKGNRALNYAAFTWAGLSNANAGAGGVVANHAALARAGHFRSTRERIRESGTGGICDIVSGSMNFSTPYALRAVGGIEKFKALKEIRKNLDSNEQTTLDLLHQHLLEFHSLAAAQPDSTIAIDDVVFAKTAAAFDQHEAMRMGELRFARTRLIDQLIFFNGIGMPKAINGMGGAYASFDYTNNAHARNVTIRNTATVYGIGYCIATAELLRNYAVNEYKAYKAKRQGHAAGWQLRAQISELDALAAQEGSAQ